MSNDSREQRDAERQHQHEEDALLAPEESILGGLLGEPYPTDAIGGGTDQDDTDSED